VIKAINPDKIKAQKVLKEISPAAKPRKLYTPQSFPETAITIKVKKISTIFDILRNRKSLSNIPSLALALHI
jgi:hypothetical protein